MDLLTTLQSWKELGVLLVNQHPGQAHQERWLRESVSMPPWNTRGWRCRPGGSVSGPHPCGIWAGKQGCSLQDVTTGQTGQWVPGSLQPQN